MNKSKRTGSHLFFIEFIIVLFFFLIVSTVCLRLFARAHGITQRADALSHAQAASASAAAAIEDILSDIDAKTGDGAPEGLLTAAAEYLPGASLSVLPDDPGREGLVIFYDKDFRPCDDAKDARYMLAAVITPGKYAETLDISVSDYDHVPIYELSVTFHRPMTRKEALQ